MTKLAAIQKQDDSALYESLALKGDLSQLKPEDKARYYSALCERLGLDPATQPFTPLKLNGKEILYATKGATDQLARLHNVNRQIVDEREVRDVYVVTVEATLPNGRKEQSKGAVTLGQLKGDAFCNAIMKAETKAKRRATLSILGLGLLDESEMETIPDYQPRPATKGELIESAKESAAASRDGLIQSVKDHCKNLNAVGDSIVWDAAMLVEYTQQLFDTDTIKSSDDLTDEQLQVLNEDLDLRLGEMEAIKAAAA